MGRKEKPVWQYYTKLQKNIEGKKKSDYLQGKCNFCGAIYMTNASRMERHLGRCPKAPKEILAKFYFQETKKILSGNSITELESSKAEASHNEQKSKNEENQEAESQKPEQIIIEPNPKNEKDEDIDFRYLMVESDNNLPVETDYGARLMDEDVEEHSNNDQYDVFGKFIASEIRNLKSELHRRDVKRAILQIFVDIYKEEDGVITVE